MNVKDKYIKDKHITLSRTQRLSLFSGVLLCLGIGLGVSTSWGQLREFWWRSPSEKSLVYVPAPARISEGEQLILAPDTNVFKEAGIVAYRAEKYREAERLFQQALNFDRDPETLIYLHNARVSGRGTYVTLGVVVALFDDMATDGAKEILRGVAQAQKEFIEAGSNVKILIGDDDGDPAIAMELAQKFVDNPEVLGVIGHLNSALSLAAGEVYQEAGLTMISPTSTATGLSDVGDYVFRTVPSTLATAMAMGEHLDQQAWGNNLVVFFNSDSPYSISLKDSIALHFSQHHVGRGTMAIVDVEQSDFDPKTAIAQFIAAGQTEVIVLATDQTTHRATATQIIKINNRQLPIIAGDDIYSQQTLIEGGVASVGMALAVPWHALTNPSALFPVNSRALWGKDVNWRSATAYDAAQAFMQALRDIPSYERQIIQQRLAATDFVAPGAAFNIEFQETGDRQFALTMVEVVADNSELGYRFVPVDLAADVVLDEEINPELPSE